jgi:hypothetical protein
LESPDLTTVAVDLNAHTFDLGPNVFDVRHGRAWAVSLFDIEQTHVGGSGGRPG